MFASDGQKQIHVLLVVAVLLKQYLQRVVPLAKSVVVQVNQGRVVVHVWMFRPVRDSCLENLKSLFEVSTPILMLGILKIVVFVDLALRRFDIAAVY